MHTQDYHTLAKETPTDPRTLKEFVEQFEQENRKWWVTVFVTQQG